MTMIPCPFCGCTDPRQPGDNDKYTWCTNQDCAIYDVEISVEKWQSRPTDTSHEIWVYVCGRWVLLAENLDIATATKQYKNLEGTPRRLVGVTRRVLAHAG